MGNRGSTTLSKASHKGGLEAESTTKSGRSRSGKSRGLFRTKSGRMVDRGEPSVLGSKAEVTSSSRGAPNKPGVNNNADDSFGNVVSWVTDNSGENSAQIDLEYYGLKHLDFINVHRKDKVARIELVQGSVEKLSPEDETDLLIVYLRKRGLYKGKRDSALAGLNRCGIDLGVLEGETKPQPSYRRHYHCWLSRPLHKPRPPGLEYKRLLVYEDPGEELTKDDNIVLDVMKCLTTVIGGDIQIRSVMLPLSGALLSPSLRKHFVKVTTEVCYHWMQMGLPLTNVRILLPYDDNITKDMEIFAGMKEKLLGANLLQTRHSYDVFLSYSEAESETAMQMINYLRTNEPSVRIYNAEPTTMKSVRDRGVVSSHMDAISHSRMFLSLLSDDYFNDVECTEAFSIAYCRHFDEQGGFILPLFWKNCDLTPLAGRLVVTEGIDCREESFDKARLLLDGILSMVQALDPKVKLDPIRDEHSVRSTLSNMDRADTLLRPQLTVADKLMMEKQGGQQLNQHNQLFNTGPGESEDDRIVNAYFDQHWKDAWSIDFGQLVFGPRIGGGGFGEVYKAKYKTEMVAVKTLQKIEDEEVEDVIAEFMLEIKLMSRLSHQNVVSFLGASLQAPNYAILLEYMQGGSLYRAIHRRRRQSLGPFPLIKTAYIAFGIARGMAYLHGLNPIIIHRDLKSPNVLLGENVLEVSIDEVQKWERGNCVYACTGLSTLIRPILSD
mmetsp:Transcript_11995/g.50107  ORF Transcript_11995/g.50107 Transcript_11995/m.50107 type:complete len:722 (-) Transcript_11995:509-2674(-)